jgi:hypothetical protein
LRSCSRDQPHKPSRLPIRRAIKQLNNNKATGPVGILAQALEADINTCVRVLHLLFKKIWEVETVPEEWKEGYLNETAKEN